MRRQRTCILIALVTALTGLVYLANTTMSAGYASTLYNTTLFPSEVETDDNSSMITNQVFLKVDGKEEEPTENKTVVYESQRSLGPQAPVAEVGSQPALLPGDSHLPHEELNYVNITELPENLFEEKPGRSNTIYPNNPPLKKILFWNDYFGIRHFSFGFGREPFLRGGCRVNTCMTTADRSRFPIEEIDAFIWHFRSGDRSFPGRRTRHSRLVFWMMESPAYLFASLQPFRNIINWTMTYRLDSDFPNLYGWVYRRRRPLEPENTNYAAGKTKLAAWFVSNCNTIGGRETLVETLREFIRIDQYGDCNQLKCERKDANKCHKMLNSDYKFYLSFENSLCRDYVTEKFFNMMRLRVVPVVYGLANYSMHAPPHSYIDALSFPTAKALADYLIYLDKNDTAYNEYFRWKRFHRVPQRWANVAKLFCDLCERLHHDNTTKVYDIKKWFEEDAHCKTKDSRDIKEFIHSGM